MRLIYVTTGYESQDPKNHLREWMPEVKAIDLIASRGSMTMPAQAVLKFQLNPNGEYIWYHQDMRMWMSEQEYVLRQDNGNNWQGLMAS